MLSVHCLPLLCHVLNFEVPMAKSFHQKRACFISFPYHYCIDGGIWLHLRLFFLLSVGCVEQHAAAGSINMSHHPPQPHQRHVVTSFALPDRFGGSSSSSGSGNNMPVTRPTGAAAPNTSLGRIHPGNQQQDRAMNSMTALEASDNLRDSSNSLQWLQLVRDVFRGSLVCWTVWHMWFAQVSCTMW